MGRGSSLPAYSRAARCFRGILHARHGLVAVFSQALRGLIVLAVSVTPGVVSSWSSHMPLRGLVVLVVSITPGVVSSLSSHTPCVGSLFSRYPSRLAWSRRGLLTRLAWARCSRGSGIRLHSSVIRLRSIFLTQGVVSLWYSASP